MEILTELRREHREALALAHRLTSTDDVREARGLYRQLRAELTAHARAEETVVYAALKKLTDGEARDIGFEGEVEHALCDRLLEEMAGGRASSDGWKAKAKVVAELLEHHVEEEHAEMFPKVNKHFDAEARERMAERFQRLKDQHLAES